MKISPIIGSGVPAQSNSPSTDPGKIARAKAIAAGLPIQEEITGDPQADRAVQDVKKIQMKTQMSTNRDDTTIQPEVVTEMAKPDTSEPVEVVEETKPLSPQFAALAKQKRALQIERAAFEKEKALRTQTPEGNNEDLIAKLKSNPLGVLLENGVTYDQLTEAILNNQSQPLDSKTIDSLVEKKLNERLEKEFGSRDQQQEKQVLADIKRDVIHTVDSKPEEFQAIREAKAYEDVKELIHRTWKKTGEVLDTHEAIQLVEDQLIEEALPFAKLSKVQERLTPREAAQVEAQLPSQRPNTKVMRTLTNRDTATPIMDRRARAIAAMTGTLKKG